MKSYTHPFIFLLLIPANYLLESDIISQGVTVYKLGYQMHYF